MKLLGEAGGDMGWSSRRDSPVAASPYLPAPLDPGGCPCAFWPEGGSIAELIDLAQRLGVLLVDAHATLLPDDVEALAARLGEVTGVGVKGILRDAEGHTGDMR